MGRKGSIEAAAVAWVPGIVSRLSKILSYILARSTSAPYVFGGRLIVIVATRFGENPRGTDAKCAALCVRRAAPARSTRDNVTSATINTLASRRFPAPCVAL